MKKRFLTHILLFLVILPVAVPADGARREVPMGVSIVLIKAGNLANQGKVKEALKTLKDFQKKADGISRKKAKKKGYTHCNVDYAIGNYLLMLDKPDEALPHYRKAVKKNDGFSEAWLNLAKCYYDTDQTKPAGGAFLKGYETGEPKASRYLYFSVVCYAGSDEFPTAYTLFHRLLKSHRNEVELQWKGTMVQVCLALEKQREALPFIEELAEKTTGEKQKEWREMLLYQYMELGMEKKALAYARWLTQVDTLEPKWWKALAHMNLQRDNYQNALTALMAYGFLKPLTPEETALIGDMFFTLEVPDQAAKYYEIEARKNPDARTGKKLVQAYMRLYEYETALLWLDKIIKPDTKEASDLLMMKGNLLFEMERFTEASKIFRKLIDSDQEKGKSLLMLGYTAWNTGNLNQAKKAFQKASRFKKQKKEAERALRQLGIRS